MAPGLFQTHGLVSHQGAFLYFLAFKSLWWLRYHVHTVKCSGPKRTALSTPRSAPVPASRSHRTLPCACLLEFELSNSLYLHTGFSNWKEIIKEKLPFLSFHTDLFLFSSKRKRTHLSGHLWTEWVLGGLWIGASIHLWSTLSHSCFALV